MVTLFYDKTTTIRQNIRKISSYSFPFGSINQFPLYQFNISQYNTFLWSLWIFLPSCQSTFGGIFGVTYILISWQKAKFGRISWLFRGLSKLRDFWNENYVKSLFCQISSLKVVPCLCNYIRGFDYCGGRTFQGRSRVWTWF